MGPYRLGGILIALGLLVLIAPIGAIGQSEEDTTDESAIGTDAIAPTLTADQEARAKELLAQDPHAKAILRGKSYQVADIGTWGGYDDEGNPEPIIGATLRLKLDEPASYAMREWPLAENPSNGRDYEIALANMAAESVSEFLVNVDLRTDEVVYFDPFGAEVRITPGRGYTTTEPGDTEVHE